MFKSGMEDRINEQIEVSNWWYTNRQISHELWWQVYDQVNTPVRGQGWQTVCEQIQQDLLGEQDV